MTNSSSSEKKCYVCQQIEKIKNRNNPLFIKEVSTGYVILKEDQYYEGYVLFLCKKHVFELHELDNDFKNKFLLEMSHVAHAIFRAFKPEKMNYELLGNKVPHLHWHLIPRSLNDPDLGMPIWKTKHELRELRLKDLEKIKSKLLKQLQLLGL